MTAHRKLYTHLVLILLAAQLASCSQPMIGSNELVELQQQSTNMGLHSILLDASNSARVYLKDGYYFLAWRGPVDPQSGAVYWSTACLRVKCSDVPNFAVEQAGQVKTWQAMQEYAKWLLGSGWKLVDKASILANPGLLTLPVFPLGIMPEIESEVRL